MTQANTKRAILKLNVKKDYPPETTEEEIREDINDYISSINKAIAKRGFKCFQSQAKHFQCTIEDINPTPESSK